jgi:hypothetical protein
MKFGNFKKNTMEFVKKVVTFGKFVKFDGNFVKFGRNLGICPKTEIWEIWEI